MTIKNLARTIDIAGFWTPSPIEIFHPGPTADQRWAARMAKARLEAAVVVEDDTPACYRWRTVAEMMGE